MPQEHLGVTIAPGQSETERRAQLDASPSWAARLGGLMRG
jgi:hypothetical protein